MSRDYQTDLQDVLAVLLARRPAAFSEKVAELLREGFSPSSIPAGARAAETPIPVADDGGAKDRLDRWLRGQDARYGKALAEIREAADALVAYENSVLLVMGEDVTVEDEKERRIAMAKAISKATEILTDEERGEHRFECKNCKAVYKITKNQRPKAGRCNACFTYWENSGRESDAPQHVIDRRIDREVTR